jgi:hypothetical protein
LQIALESQATVLSGIKLDLDVDPNADRTVIVQRVAEVA